MDGKINRMKVVTWNDGVTWTLPALAVHVRKPKSTYLQQRLSGKTRAQVRYQRKLAQRIE